MDGYGPSVDGLTYGSLHGKGYGAGGGGNGYLSPPADSAKGFSGVIILEFVE